MKKTFSSGALFIFAMMILTLAGNVSAKTENNCVSGQNTIANAPEASVGVVINEVYGGSETGGVYNADFIELYNSSSAAVNISDYSVQYYTAGQINGGAPTSTAHIPDGTIMAPFSFYVIRVSPDNRAGAVFPCTSLNASASFAETGIASEGGKLVLSSTGADLPDCTSSLNVVDRLGWGIAPEFECNELFNAGEPTTAKSVQRRSGRGDTDNNSTDFTVLSTPTPCGQILASTAATVNISGIVTNSSGIGLSGAIISMTDSNGIIRTTTTDSSGSYNFADVQAGLTYIMTVRSKRIIFSQPTQILSVSDDTTNVNFVGNYARTVKDSRMKF